MSRLIDVENLTLQFDTDEGRITAVDDVSFSLEAGEVMGLVGESGSGKSVTAKAIMQLDIGLEMAVLSILRAFGYVKYQLTKRIKIALYSHCI